MVSSFSFPYQGGTYRGNVKFVRMKPSGRKGRARQLKMIPHGRGTYIYDGMTFNGTFRDGFEDVGTLTWPDGSSFVGKFNGGFPEPKVLKFYHSNCILKSKIQTLQKKLDRKQAEVDDYNAHLVLAQAEVEEYKEDLDVEKDTTMQVALTLDRCQAKLRRIFEFATEHQGVSVSDLRNIVAVRDY